MFIAAKGEEKLVLIELIVTSGQSIRPTKKMIFSKASIDSNRIKEAARKGNLAIVKRYSNKFSDEFFLLSEALIESCMHGHLNVVKWLVENTAADVNFSGRVKGTNVPKEEINYYYTPLTAACSYGHFAIVKYLVETSRVLVNLPDLKYNYTPLLRACIDGNMQVLKYLLCIASDIGVNISDNVYGQTALHYAISCCSDSRTQLHEACIAGDLNEVRRLELSSPHLINVQDNSGQTPLHWACYYGHEDIVISLMFAGADETIANIDRKTPSQWAKNRGHNKLLKLLDRNSIWEKLNAKKLSKKLVIFHLTFLTLKVMNQRLTRKKWCNMTTIVYIMLIVSKNYYTLAVKISA